MSKQMREMRRVPVQYDVTLFNEDDAYLFNEGSHFRLYDKLGAHPISRDGVEGTYFAVWAPNADVYVTGSFNGWNKSSHRLEPFGSSGVRHGFIPGVGRGAVYKYRVASRYTGYQADKADPFGFFTEQPPRTASVICDLDYEWGDLEWMRTRGSRNNLQAPISTYEVHLGSWRRVPEEGNRWLTYREIAPQLAEYVKYLGFTHVEFMPIMEHPFFGSWGYQVTGYFAPSSRYGSPQDFMYLIDYLHQQGIGVILDWVPSHFPTDEHGLIYFDGTHLFEHADVRQGMHRDWNTAIFNYGRREVQSFVVSSGLFWLDKYHIDGLRVDAVASMLYLDYSRKAGEWVPNVFGGRENLEAIDLLRRFNSEVYRSYPDVQTIAEESTAWPMVSRPTYVGGLGFGLKWDMGWMHDTLKYFEMEPVHRKFHHNQITFRMIYAFNENFQMPLSHDEVVYGKGSLLNKMPGDYWQKFANLRLLLGYMYAQPGKKLLFMGGEFGQWNEWNHELSLDWHLTHEPSHRGCMEWMRDLNLLYQTQPALFQLDSEWIGFQWVEANDGDNSVIAFLRKGKEPGNEVLVVCNFTPVPRHSYRIGVPKGGFWRELLNSDSRTYWGSGQGNMGGVPSAPFRSHGMPASIYVTLPPLGIVFFKRDQEAIAS